MAYLHCHNCGWSQDDFWDPNGYHPFRQDIVDHLTKSLFSDMVDITDETGRRGRVDGRAYVANELEKMAHRIRNMSVRSEAEWRQVKSIWVCPNCQQRKWDID